MKKLSKTRVFLGVQCKRQKKDCFSLIGSNDKFAINITEYQSPTDFKFGIDVNLRANCISVCVSGNTLQECNDNFYDRIDELRSYLGDIAFLIY